MKEKVLVAMSGGVDSAVAALLIKEAGYDTAGVTMRLCDKETNDIDDAKRICDAIGIEHYTVDLRADFERLVVGGFIDEYKNGGTPNPCVECNRTIKFGKLLAFAASLGYDKLATGHYAIVEKGENGRYLLKSARDKRKDQSYFLWSLTQDVLSRVLFPLGQMSKDEIRAIAAKNGFVNAHKSDSQDICFIEDGDYAGFIERTTKEIFPKGNFIDTNGKVLGEHSGIIRYTVGQRKGLGIALGKPAFVREKDPVANTVTLCEEAELYKTDIQAVRCNFSAIDGMARPTHLCAKIRYRQEASSAVVTQTSPSTFHLVFDEPQRAPAKGQSVVLYDGDTVVGGGIID